jgi:hypothetical protein
LARVLVIVILVAVWAVVLVPPLVRARTERSGDSIGDFKYRLGVLGRTNGSPHRAPAATAPARSVAGFRAAAVPAGRQALRPDGPGPRSAAERRRTILQWLGGVNAVSGLLFAATGASLFLAMLVLALFALGAYLALWAYVRSLQAEQSAKVRYLPSRRSTPELALRRTASS